MWLQIPPPDRGASLPGLPGTPWLFPESLNRRGSPETGDGSNLPQRGMALLVSDLVRPYRKPHHAKIHSVTE